jgi:hypothetical protein
LALVQGSSVHLVSAAYRIVLEVELSETSKLFYSLGDLGSNLLDNTMQPMSQVSKINRIRVKTFIAVAAFSIYAAVSEYKISTSSS